MLGSPDATAITKTGRSSSVGVSAVWHLPSTMEMRSALEEDNEVNPKAVLVNTLDGQKFGYVPDWLCPDVHARIKDGWSITAIAERVNPDAPAHVRVLCRLEAFRG